MLDSETVRFNLLALAVSVAAATASATDAPNERRWLRSTLARSDVIGAAATVGHLASFGPQRRYFEPNEGQAEAWVRYVGRAPGIRLLLKPDSVVVAVAGRPDDLQRPSPTRELLRLGWHGGNERPQIEPLERLPGVSHYLAGGDPSRWSLSVPSFARVRYREIYPGIALEIHGTDGQLEYDLVLAPGAEPHRIQLTFDGAGGMRIAPEGDLLVQSPAGLVRQLRPMAFQVKGGLRQPVSAEFVLGRQRRVGFRLGAYDRSAAVIIDPQVVFSTFVGGSAGSELVRDLALDPAGNIYVTGVTQSLDLPVLNALYPSYGGGANDTFVAKYAAAGTRMFTTYLASPGNDTPGAIGLDPSGNIWVTGQTNTAVFPTRNAFQASYGGGASDGFVVELDNSGSTLLFGSLIGGSAGDPAYDLAVNSAGSVYIAGTTQSTDFPVTSNALQFSIGGGYDVYLVKVSPAGAVEFATYLGGNADEEPHGISVGPSGDVDLVGITRSMDWPLACPTQATFGGDHDAFITRLRADGAALLFSTYLGGSSFDNAATSVVGASGYLHVVGQTRSSLGFPIVGALPRAQSTPGGGTDAYLATFDPRCGGGFVWSTFIGGSGYEEANDIAVDQAGRLFVVGATTSTAGFPITPDALQGTFAGGTEPGDGFIVSLDDPGQQFLYGTYMGSSGRRDTIMGVKSHGSIVVVAGSAAAAGFPIRDAAQPTFGGGDSDGFVAALAFNSRPTARCKASPVQTNNDAGLCSAGVSIDDGSSDPDGDSLTLSQSPAGPYPVGLTLVTLTVSDGQESDSCSSDVVVRDAEPPTVVCVPPSIAECEGPSGAVVTFAPTATDNCSVSAPSCAPASGSIFPLGSTAVYCAASDGTSQSACGFAVTVADRTPPSVLGVLPTLTELWPPNHRMVAVALAVTTADRCDTAPSCRVVSVASNEPADAHGDGATVPDWEITGPLSVNLRAERSGQGNGRTYTVGVECSDASGNVATGSATVVVPQSRAKSTR